MRARFALVAALALLAAGCASTDFGTSPGPPVAAPTFKVGDRWVYRGREGFRVGMEWEETHEVTAVDANGITVHVTYNGERLTGDRFEVLQAPGLVMQGALMDIETRRFDEPLKRYVFPLTPGETWNQWVNNLNETTRKFGQINRYGRVEGWTTVATPAGTFDAIRVRVLMRLDDEEFWRLPTQCNYLIWYAPAAGAPVREEKEAEYWEKGDRMDGMGAVRAQHTLLELVSFSHAP
ncbi:MAG TPA: hypothetical protein VGI14_12585 [Casimicrobiaceae bacterium]|jgi:hypothetical protein